MVKDINYWRAGSKYLDISLITDACFHKIVGFDIAKTLESIETIKALQMVLKYLQPLLTASLIHYSDEDV